MIFGMFQPEEIWQKQLIDLSTVFTSPVRLNWTEANFANWSYEHMRSNKSNYFSRYLILH